MVNLKKVINNSYFFPIAFLVLHIFTYGIYFFIANEKTPVLWLDERRIELINLIWFYSTWWPNWAGLFVIYGYFSKKISFRLGSCYLFGLYVEQFFIGADYMGSYESFPLTVVNYKVFITHLNFSDIGNHHIVHFTMLLACFHIIIVFIKHRISSKTGKNHGTLG